MHFHIILKLRFISFFKIHGVSLEWKPCSDPIDEEHPDNSWVIEDASPESNRLQANNDLIFVTDLKDVRSYTHDQSKNEKGIFPCVTSCNCNHKI